MKLKIISGVCLGSGRDAYPGDEVELEQHHAARLIALGFAVPAEAAPAPPEMESEDETRTPEPDEIVDREPEPEHREPRRRHGKETE